MVVYSTVVKATCDRGFILHDGNLSQTVECVDRNNTVAWNDTIDDCQRNYLCFAETLSTFYNILSSSVIVITESSPLVIVRKILYSGSTSFLSSIFLKSFLFFVRPFLPICSPPLTKIPRGGNSSVFRYPTRTSYWIIQCWVGYHGFSWLVFLWLPLDSRGCDYNRDSDAGFT